MHLDNNGIATTPAAASPENTPIAFGGMLTFMQVAGSSRARRADQHGRYGPVVATATVTSTGSTVAAAEYFVDTTGAGGTGCPMSGTFGSASVAVTATILTSGAVAPCIDLAGLARYAHGLRPRPGCQQCLGSVRLGTFSKPSTSGVSLTPNITNGTGLVTLAATETSAASTVTAAEYFVDAVGTSGAGCAMTGSFGARASP